ncbi:hypothetical protein ACTJJ4_17155 [Microbacterium sp. 22195]|uniref:hypothetical protein n=1 Tax=Microbacterium sp. 22195 TaxID=3453891 RepID=UPI003F833FB5
MVSGKPRLGGDVRLGDAPGDPRPRGSRTSGCACTCEVNDWIDFTYTVDPGGSGSRILIQTAVWGSKLGSYMVQGEVYRNVEMIKLKATGYVGGPGQSTTTTLWMSPHLSLTGYKFFANVSTFVETPGINPANPESGAYEWRTGMTDTCSEPTPGAWRCIFLQ